MSVSLSSRWVAKLWRSACSVTPGVCVGRCGRLDVGLLKISALTFSVVQSRVTPGMPYRDTSEYRRKAGECLLRAKTTDDVLLKMHWLELADLKIVAVNRRLRKPAFFAEDFLSINGQDRLSKKLVEGEFDGVFLVRSNFN